MIIRSQDMKRVLYTDSIDCIEAKPGSKDAKEGKYFPVYNGGVSSIKDIEKSAYGLYYKDLCIGIFHSEMAAVTELTNLINADLAGYPIHEIADDPLVYHDTGDVVKISSKRNFADSKEIVVV